jgi:hypothetical protein
MLGPRARIAIPLSQNRYSVGLLEERRKNGFLDPKRYQIKHLGFFFLEFSSSWNRNIVRGQYVHIVFQRGWQEFSIEDGGSIRIPTAGTSGCGALVELQFFCRGQPFRHPLPVVARVSRPVQVQAEGSICNCFMNCSKAGRTFSNSGSSVVNVAMPIHLPFLI